MKNTAICMLIACGIAYSASGKGYSPLPACYDGTMMPYNFELEERVEVPDSLTPVCVSYLARHGARYLSSEKKVSSLLTILEEKYRQGLLTRHGQEFLALVKSVDRNSTGRWGMLSSVGQHEEVELGKRMALQWPELLSGGKVVAISTYVPRVFNTMYTFTSMIGGIYPHLNISTSEGEVNSPLLRFFDTDHLYYDWLHPVTTDTAAHEGIASDSWQEPLQRFEETHTPVAPAASLFKALPSKKELQKITMEMYGVLQGMRASGFGAPTEQWMSEADYRACWECSNANHYFKRSLTSFSTMACSAASPLLMHMIGNIDRVLITPVDNNSTRGYLYFGHAETLLPMAALMDLPGATALPLDYNNLADHWRDYEITPLGANITIAIARNPESGLYYCSLALNGQFSPWQSWSEIRAHWLDRIAAFTS